MKKLIMLLCVSFVLASCGTAETNPIDDMSQEELDIMNDDISRISNLLTFCSFCHWEKI